MFNGETSSGLIILKLMQILLLTLTYESNFSAGNFQFEFSLIAIVEVERVGRFISCVSGKYRKKIFTNCFWKRSAIGFLFRTWFKSFKSLHADSNFFSIFLGFRNSNINCQLLKFETARPLSTCLYAAWANFGFKPKHALFIKNIGKHLLTGVVFES